MRPSSIETVTIIFNYIGLRWLKGVDVEKAPHPYLHPQREGNFKLTATALLLDEVYTS